MEQKPLVKQPTWQPTRKLASGTVAGLVLVILTWVDDKYLNNQAPQDVEAAIVLLGTIAVGYVTKNRKV
jgi:hypothetical protein